MTYTRGAHEIADGTWAYLQPDGGWGWSNAGLVTDGDASLLVDTLFDLALTATMLDELRALSPAAASIGTLVNTHANGDHCYGNQLVAGAEIVASTASAHEMDEVPPAMLASLLRGRTDDGQGRRLPPADLRRLHVRRHRGRHAHHHLRRRARPAGRRPRGAAARAGPGPHARAT